MFKILYLTFLWHSVFARSTINYPLATTESTQASFVKDNWKDEGRGMTDYDHEEMKEMPEQKAVKNDPWAGYYDFIINEGSFKFWAAFQLATAVLLIYSACAAVYFAKFNVITTDYDYYDEFFFGRSDSGTPPSSNSWLNLGAQKFQSILNAITSKKYS